MHESPLGVAGSVAGNSLMHSEIHLENYCLDMVSPFDHSVIETNNFGDLQNYFVLSMLKVRALRTSRAWILVYSYVA